MLSKGFVNIMKNIEKDGEIIGKRLIRNKKEIYIDDTNELSKWKKVYHGTRIVSIEQILCVGLRCVGEPLTYHIPLGEKVNDIENWASGIFISPSIFYASKYSEIIYSEKEEWFVIIEARVSPNSFTEHGNTIYGYKYKISEPEKIEYRITASEVNYKDPETKIIDFNHDIDKKIETISLIFVKMKFLENCKNYKESFIFEKI